VIVKIERAGVETTNHIDNEIKNKQKIGKIY